MIRTVLFGTLILLQAGPTREYVDAQGRFRFTYPAEFGTSGRGTDDGFGDRVAAVRFDRFSAGGTPAGATGTPVIGGEVVLTRGFPLIDLQAVGGLYDAIALQALPDRLRAAVIRSLVRLSPSNFCAQLAQERHLAAGDPAFQALTAQQRAAIESVDRMRHAGPKVRQCTVSGSAVTFDVEVGFDGSATRQRVYGAIRFLEGRYSTFQVVRAGAAPSPALLESMTAIVQSFVAAT